MQRLAAFVVFVGLVIVGGLFVLDSAIDHGADGLPTRQNVFAANIQVVSNNGTPLAELGGPGATENRYPLPVGSYSQRTINVLLAAEDANFFSHDGVDMGAIPGAIAQSRGASTITMQYVKETEMDGEINGDKEKLEQAGRARNLEQSMQTKLGSKQAAKDWIINAWANLFYLGRNARGLEAGAQAYFGHSAAGDNLSLLEPATLAAIISDPKHYTTNPQTALKDRRNAILNNMVELKFISADEAVSLAGQPVDFQDNWKRVPTIAGSGEPYLTTVVTDLLKKRISTDEYARGGLTVTLTIDARIHAAANQAVASKIGNMGLGTGLVLLNPSTGEITAYVGNKANFAKDQLDYNRAGSNGGSTMKAFTVAEVVSRGIALDSKIPNPATFRTADKTDWPNNLGQSQVRDMTIADCLKYSANNCFLSLITGDMRRVGSPKDAPPERLMQEDAANLYPVSPGSMATLFRNLGGNATVVDGDPAAKLDDRSPAITLGTGTATTPFQRAYALSTIINGGVTPKGDAATGGAVLIKKVTNSAGTTLYEATLGAGKRVIPQNVAGTTARALEGVKDGTGQGLAIAGQAEARKTGTGGEEKNGRNIDTDAAYIGGNRHSVCSVGIRFKDAHRAVPNGVNGSFAGHVCRIAQIAAFQGKPGVSSQALAPGAKPFSEGVRIGV